MSLVEIDLSKPKSGINIYNDYLIKTVAKYSIKKRKEKIAHSFNNDSFKEPLLNVIFHNGSLKEPQLNECAAF
jgi:hypothetical protein